MDIHPQEQNPPDEDSSSPAQERSTSTVQAATPAISTAISTTENAVSFAGAVTAYPSDYQLAGLIEAAAAAGQDLTWNHAQDTAVSVGNEQIPVLSGNAHAQTQTERFVPSMPVDSALASRSSIPPMQEQVFDLQNGLQETSAAAEAQLQNQAGQQQSQNLATSPANTRKRKRTSAVAGTEASSNQNIDPAIMVPSSQAAQYTGVATQYVGVTPSPGGTENPPFSIVEPDPNYRPLTPPRPLHDFRAAGIHSAAALFRKPTDKKHTRPPMANMYTSLELSPENFLHLQAAAKAYMLDPEHPERQDCVGQRGKGDNEIVKLRLYNCVREFLGPMGNGERYFGEHVVDPEVEHRTLYWPQDEQRLIALMMPLLRRMVTNERQRQYAIESRKHGAEKRRKEKLRQEGRSEQGSASPSDQTQGQDLSPSSSSAIDPGLLDLLGEGSPTDWESVSQIYDSYNHDNQLDNLAAISGLKKTDWWGLVAVIESHYRFVHNYDPSQCFRECEQYLIDRIVSSATFSNVEWKGVELKRYLITSLVRDVLQVMRTTLLHGQELQPDVAELATAQEDIPIAAEPVDEQNHSGPPGITVQVNLVAKRDNKRLHPPIFVTQTDSSNLSTLLEKAQNQASTLEQMSAEGKIDLTSGLTFPVKVWMPDGLLPVHDEEEWQVALMTLLDTEWIDKQIKILVDVPGTD